MLLTKRKFLQASALVVTPGALGYRHAAAFDQSDVLFNGPWGEGNPQILEVLCEGVIEFLSQHLTLPEKALLPKEIHVRHRGDGPPMALYRGQPGSSPVYLLLSAYDRYWAQYLFQFSHEFGHIMINFRRVNLANNPYHWLDEALCGAISIHALFGMVEHWPFPDDHYSSGFRPALYEYAQDVKQQFQGDYLNFDPRHWYQANAAELEQTKGLFRIQEPFSAWLADVFAAEPDLVADLRYLNFWDVTKVRHLSGHLRLWQERAPYGRKELPILIARALGVG